MAISNFVGTALEERFTSGVYYKRPLTLVRGEGARLWDEEGREYLDCVAGHGVANIGHGRQEIATALAAQAQQLITCPEIFYNDVRGRLLARLAALTPPGLTRFFLCNSGTEAIEGAIKFARLATGRPGIIAALRGFHGRTLGALAATWERSYRDPFEPLVPAVQHVRYNDLEAIAAAIDEQTAAVLIELVQGEGGVHLATGEYVRGLATLCRKRGVLLIVDEVQTGLGRTGRLFACEHYELQPDILCLAKALAGGVPMGAIGLGERVLASGRVRPGLHGSTFGGNPLACAAALETLAILERERLAERAEDLGRYALERLRRLRSPRIREVRGLGLLLGIELRERVQAVLEELQARGVLALPAGPNVLRLLPPLVITHEQLEQVLATLEEVLGGESAPEVTRSRAEVQEFDPEVAFLRDLVAIPSYSGQEGTLADFLAEAARRFGLNAQLDEAGNMIAWIEAAPMPDDVELAPVVLLGHMDTVPGLLPVTLKDGVLTGRGSVDAKGALAAFVCAAARLARRGVSRRSLVIIGVVEEESAFSRGARAVIERYQPHACIIGEPSGSRAVTLGYKGRLLVAGRVTRPLSHTAVPDPLACELAAGYWERVRAHAEAWNAEHAGTSTFASLQPTLRALNSEQNGLMTSACFSLGYRLPPGYDLEGLRRQLEDWARQDGIELSFTGAEAAYQVPRTTGLARAFVEAIRARGAQPAFKLKTGTADLNVVGPSWGPNIVAYGPGDARLDHTPGEQIQIAEYLEAIAVLEQVVGGLIQ